MAIVENRSTEIGDVMRIESDVPIVGIVTLNNYIDDIQGEQIIDGDPVNINAVILSQDISEDASFDGSEVVFSSPLVNGELGLVEIQKDELEAGKTYKLEFTVKQNMATFHKLNLYHSSASAIIQYSQIQVGQDVGVLCLITPTVNDSDTNKNLRLSISDISVQLGDSIVLTDFSLNEVSTQSRYFKKEFRYSTDGGLNFTGWMDLNNVNVQNIVVSRRDLFVTEIKLTRQGLNPTGELVFNSLNIGGIYKELPYKIYGKTIFNDFFTVNDAGVIAWQINVLEKLYKDGILPWYIERDTGEEYIIGQPSLPQQYTVTVSVVGGTSDNASVTVEEGEGITVKFTPDADKYLYEITVNGEKISTYNTDQDNLTTISITNITEDKLVSANFIDIPDVGYLYNLRTVLPTDPDKNLISNGEWFLPSSSDFYSLRSMAPTGVPQPPLRYRTLFSHKHINNQSMEIDSYTNRYNFSAYYKVPCIVGGQGMNNYLVQEDTRYIMTDGVVYLTNGFFDSSNIQSGFLVRLCRNLKTGESSLPNGTVLSEVYVGNDLKEYRLVKMGNRVWLAEDLKETKYVDGTDVQEFLTVFDWQEYHKTASPILGSMIKVENISV